MGRGALGELRVKGKNKRRVVRLEIKRSRGERGIR